MGGPRRRRWTRWRTARKARGLARVSEPGIAVSCGCGPTSPEPNSYILILNGRTDHIQLRVRKTTQPSLFCSFVFVAAQTRHLYPLIMVMATLLSGATATAISGRRTLHVTCSQQPSTRSACLRLGLAAVLLQPQRDVAYAAADEPEPANNGVPPASAQNSKQYVIQFFLRFTYSLFILYSILQRKEANKLLCLPATEEINNAETGTRSFLKKGIYMADIGPSLAAHAHRHRPPGAGRQGRLQLRQQVPPPQVHLHVLRLRQAHHRRCRRRRQAAAALHRPRQPPLRQLREPAAGRHRQGRPQHNPTLCRHKDHPTGARDKDGLTTILMPSLSSSIFVTQ
jgi:hypothetical protein